METEVAKHDDDLEAMNKKLATLDSTVSPKCLIRDKYKKWHSTQEWQDVPAAGWRALRGWKYGKSVFERRSKLAEVMKGDDYCTTCFDVDSPDSDYSEPVVASDAY